MLFIKTLCLLYRKDTNPPLHCNYKPLKKSKVCSLQDIQTEQRDYKVKYKSHSSPASPSPKSDLEILFFYIL